MTSIDTNKKDCIRETITEEVYNYWALHYNKFNWVANWTPYKELEESEKQFWRTFIKVVLRKVKFESLALKEEEN